jgi:hypothetical protein
VDRFVHPTQVIALKGRSYQHTAESRKFKLQSRQLLWLAVRDEGTAYLGGFASIQGMYGEFPFVAVIIDGTSTASADRFELQVYEPGTEIASPTPLFAASGEVGGQIQIRS